MLLKKYPIMLLLVVCTSVIFGTAFSSYVKRIQGINDTNVQSITIETEDSCASFDCQNDGVCMIVEKSPVCLCQTGYYGLHCEEIVDPCMSIPCQNKGICIQKGKYFSCHCRPSYRGEFCEKDPCTENPCQNGGTCLLTEYSYKCQCRYPYSGDTCQYDACHDNPCFNGGTCEKNGEFFICKCRYGYYGNVCEKEGYESTPDSTTLTTVKPGICTGDTDCLNNGICRKSYCECPTNFDGYWCEKNLLCEKLTPTCRAMGAICRIVGLNAICDCPQDKMYHPKSGICEDICDLWKCINGRCEIDGRTYKCICDPGYSGHRCDEAMHTKEEKSSLLFIVAISFMGLICLLLIVQMCIFCRKQKFKFLTNDVVLSNYTGSGTTPDA